MSLTKVFVYGTLKKGFGNHHHLKTSKYIGPYLTEPLYDMFAVGSHGGFPILVSGSCKIKGEVYEVTPEVLTRLDSLEGVPHMYFRDEILLSTINKSIGKVNAYFWAKKEYKTHGNGVEQYQIFEHFIKRWVG